MFWKLLEQSVLTSGLVACALIGTACYCTIAQIPLPEYLGLAIGTVIGYFFSQKASAAQARRIS
jgi:hypothetical protein